MERNQPVEGRFAQPVPRFFFHLHNDLDVRDDEGRELPDVEAARREARQDARTMAAESVRMGRLDLDHFIVVTDEDDEPLFRVTFGEVVEIGPGGLPAGNK